MSESVKTTTQQLSCTSVQEDTSKLDPLPPPLGPPRNVQGTRYSSSNHQQFATSGRMNTYSSSCDEDYDPDEAADSFIQVTISDPQKMGEGMSSYMAYRLTTKTNKSGWPDFFRVSKPMSSTLKTTKKPHVHSCKKTTKKPYFRK